MDFQGEDFRYKQFIWTHLYLFEQKRFLKKDLRNSVLYAEERGAVPKRKQLNIKTTADASFYALAPIMRKRYAEACPSQMLIIKE